MRNTFVANASKFLEIKKIMKTSTLFAAFAFSVGSSAMISPIAYAGYTCSTDYFGNETCR